MGSSKLLLNESDIETEKQYTLVSKEEKKRKATRMLIAGNERK